jgi:hypothetical protein
VRHKLLGAARLAAEALVVATHPAAAATAVAVTDK